jgi:hypothetical protein
MMYHMQDSISQPCAPGLYRVFCSWMDGWMQNDSHHSDRFIFSSDHSFYDLYNITHLNFVSIFCP